MTNHEDPRRGTGRTTRMLAEAVRLAREGREVVVLAANGAHAETLRLFLGEAGVETTGEIRRAPSDPALRLRVRSVPFVFDWERMRERGMSPDAVVLADHYAIEQHLAKAFEELHRYDADRLAEEHEEPAGVLARRTAASEALNVLAEAGREWCATEDYSPNVGTANEDLHAAANAWALAAGWTPPRSRP